MGSLSPRGPLLPAQVSLLFVLDDGAFGITLTHNTLVPEVFFCHKERIGRRGGGEEERRRGGEEERRREKTSFSGRQLCNLTAAIRELGSRSDSAS